MSKTNAFQFCIQFLINTEEEEFCDIDSHELRMSILQEVSSIVSDGESIHDKCHLVERVRSGNAEHLSYIDKHTKQSSLLKRGSFLPSAGDDVFLFTFGKTREKMMGLSDDEPSLEKTENSQMFTSSCNMFDLVVHILIRGWTSVQDIVNIAREKYDRHISPHSVRRVLSVNKDMFKKRRPDPSKRNTEYTNI